MTYKTILICLNEASRVEQLISVARELGSRFQAHMHGLYVIPAPEIYVVSAYAVGASYDDTYKRFHLDRLEKVKARFAAAMQADGLTFSFQQAESAEADITAATIKQCRSADLVMLSQTNPKGTPGISPDFAERVVVGAGRPVLVLPFAGTCTAKTDHVVLGWDDSREASRAAFDALPFMVDASTVHVVTVDAAPRKEVPGASIAEALGRHGVKATTMTVTSDGLGIGATLLRTAQDQGAGLIVTGAYGHGRFSEFVFGGATRDMVKQLDRPVLMSH